MKIKREALVGEYITDALLFLMKKKAYKDISITEICEKAGVTRMSFYRNFDNLIDVLQMKCDQCFEEVLTQGLANQNHAEDPKAFLIHFFRYWIKNRELLEILVAMNRQDIIYTSHFKHSLPITAHFLPEVDTDSEEYIYFMSVRTSITVGVLTAWVRTGKTKTPEQLVELLIKLGRQALSGEIFL